MATRGCHDVLDRREYPRLQRLFERLEADSAVRFAHAIERLAGE